MKKRTNPPVSPQKQTKIKHFRTEKEAIRHYLSCNIATATMAAVALKIYRPNLSWHKRALEKEGQLKVLFTGKCKVTKSKACYLTTNPAIINNVEIGARYEK